MIIKLQKLRIKHFKGISDFTFQPDGQSATIYGRNGAGKSTVADGLSWLLFGKNQAGDSAFSVKPLDGKSGEVPKTAPTVEGTFWIIEYGVGDYPITLKRSLIEKWVEKRKAREEVREGNYTAYWINEKEVQATEYKDFIDTLIREDLFRILSSLTHFAEKIDINTRRALMVEISGVTDESILSAKEFAKLVEELGVRKIGDLKAIKEAAQKEKLESLKSLRAKIEEAELGKNPDGECAPPKGVNYADQKAKLTELQNRRAAILAGDTSGIQQQITAKEREIAKAEDDHRRAVIEVTDKRRTIQIEIDKIGPKITEQEFSVKALKSEQAKKEEQVSELLADHADIKARIVAGTQCCPTCKQSLPEDNGAAAEVRKSIIQELNAELETCILRGRAAKERIKEIPALIEAAEATIATLTTKRDSLTADIADLKAPDGPATAGLTAELEALNAQLSTQSTPDTEKIDAEIAAVEDLIAKCDLAAANNKATCDAVLRVKALEDERSATGKELDAIEATLALITRYNELKMTETAKIINATLAPEMQVRMFKQQQNGGFANDCEILAPSPDGSLVPFNKDCNTGHRILAGLKLIKILGEHYGASVPVFVDNAESLTLDIPEMDSQIIRLVARDTEVFGGQSGLMVEVGAATTF